MLERFREVAESREDQIAVSNEQHEATFGQLLRDERALRSLIPDDEKPVVVLLALPGGPHFTAVILAALDGRAVVAPIPHRVTEHEGADYLELIDPDLIVVESLETAAPLVKSLRSPAVLLSLNEEDPTRHGDHRVISWGTLGDDRQNLLRSKESGFPEGSVLVQFTSGSTSKPKGILVSTENLLANQDNNTDFLQRFSDRHVFCPIPQFHAMGGAVVLEHLLVGSPVHLSNGFFPGEHLSRMQRCACSAILASPNYFKLLLRFGALNPDLLPSLECLVIGTATVEESLVSDLREVFPEVSMWLRYGLSEAVGALTRLHIPAGEGLAHPGLVGSLVPGIELAPGLRAPDRGEARELRVRGGTTAVGQLLEQGRWEDSVDDEGYLSTGDLGFLDHRGQIHLRGRLSSFIKSDGYRVNPFEVERVLTQVEGVHEAVVVGVPDAMSGERIVACLEPSPGGKAPQTAELAAYCGENLSAHKVPRKFEIMDALPRTPSGKPDRKRILARLLE